MLFCIWGNSSRSVLSSFSNFWESAAESLYDESKSFNGVNCPSIEFSFSKCYLIFLSSAYSSGRISLGSPVSSYFAFSSIWDCRLIFSCFTSFTYAISPSHSFLNLLYHESLRIWSKLTNNSRLLVLWSAVSSWLFCTSKTDRKSVV